MKPVRSKIHVYTLILCFRYALTGFYQKQIIQRRPLRCCQDVETSWMLFNFKKDDLRPDYDDLLFDHDTLEKNDAFFIIIIAPSRFILWREKEMIFKNLVSFYSRAMHGVPKSSLESLFLEKFSWHWKFLLKLQILDEPKNWNSAKGDLSKL